MIWAVHVACMREKKACNILVGEREVKRRLDESEGNRERTGFLYLSGGTSWKAIG
jgi:hypothetical protein